MKRDQHGFSLIHGLLVVLVMAAVCGVGYVAYSTNRDKVESKSTAEVVSTKTPSDWQDLKTDFDFTLKAPADWSLGSSSKGTYDGVTSKGAIVKSDVDDLTITLGSLALKDTSKAAFESYLANLEANTLKTYQSLGYGNSNNNTTVTITKLLINGVRWQQSDLVTPTLFSRTLYLWHDNHADTLIVDTGNKTKAEQLSTSHLYPMAASLSQNRQ